MQGTDWAFIASLVILTAVSWRSLGRPMTHGFYRLLGFLAIAAMAWLTYPGWGQGGDGWMAGVSSACLFGSLYLVLHGMFCLVWYGGASAERKDAANFAFENTGRLVDVGLYRYIRHPMYASLILLLWGFYCKSPQLHGTLLALAGTLVLVRAARVEERENIQVFGRAYRDYIERTWMFAPFLL
jgi:protein-S-isoprenylcysteine O-methyltransferase Ste14